MENKIQQKLRLIDQTLTNDECLGGWEGGRQGGREERWGEREKEREGEGEKEYN
jgi:hypothetical protein